MDVKSDMPDIEKARELVSDGRLWPLVRDFLWGADAPCGEGKVFADFSEPGHARIMLLDAATIDKIARWVGVVVYSRQLGAITDGPGVRALKAALPGAYPDVFSFTAYFKNVPAAPKAGEKGRGGRRGGTVGSTRRGKGFSAGGCLGVFRQTRACRARGERL